MFFHRNSIVSDFIYHRPCFNQPVHKSQIRGQFVCSPIVVVTFLAMMVDVLSTSEHFAGKDSLLLRFYNGTCPKNKTKPKRVNWELLCDGVIQLLWVHSCRAGATRRCILNKHWQIISHCHTYSMGAVRRGRWCCWWQHICTSLFTC